MKIWSFLACVLAILCISVQDRPPKEYELNLDLPPNERWKKIADDNKELFRYSIKEAMRLILSQPEIARISHLIEKIADMAEFLLPYEMAEEIKGMAEALDIEVGDLVLENILYDVTAFGQITSSPRQNYSGKHCTSIVAQDENGMIWHGRNLDYGDNSAFVETLKNVTLNIDFVRHGKVVYKATTFAGLTGLFTAQKPGVLTFSLDERDQGYAIENILVDILYRNTTLTSHLMRQTIDKVSSFNEAVEILKSARTPAPSYVILGGTKPGEGVVITKDRLKAQDLWYLDTEQNRWFVLETNYDHWKPAPKSDDRRDAGIKAMNAMGQSNITMDNLYHVLSTKPVLNSKTTYTTIMSAAKPGLYQAWIRGT